MDGWGAYQNMKKENKDLKLKLNENNISNVKQAFDIIIDSFNASSKKIPEPEDEDEKELRLLIEERDHKLAVLQEKMRLKKQSKIDELNLEIEKNIKENTSELIEKIKVLETEAKIKIEDKNKPLKAEIEKLKGFEQKTMQVEVKRERAKTINVGNECEFFTKLGIDTVYYGKNFTYPLKILNGQWVDNDGEKHEIMHRHSRKQIKIRCGDQPTTRENAWEVHFVYLKNGKWKSAKSYKPT